MFLKAGSVKKYGIPYQGSKSKIIDKIARFFPNADHFYDLFGGGFSATHYMLENRSKSFQQFHYNEIRPGLCEMIQKAIAGGYSYNVFKPEWISRERFMRDKENDAYIKMIWSFGNNGEGYIFGKDIESSKRSMHQAVVFDEFDQFMKDVFGISCWPNSMSIQAKRVYLKKIIAHNGRVDLEQLERLERLAQLERLERLAQLERLGGLPGKIQFTTGDYRDVEIKDNSVIYCDIPYQGTADYGSSFSHKDFFDWANAQNNPVFISEYNVSDIRFYLLKEFVHRTTFANGHNDKVTERLYANTPAFEIIKAARNK